jgi:hypothetical protein
MHLTWSPFASVEDVKVLFVPTVLLFTFHTYEGLLPPFTGDGVKVTLVPAHMAPGGTAEMLTLTGRLGFTFMVIWADVAGFPVVQVNEDVSVQVITFPSAKVVEEYVLPVPTRVLPLYHW